MNQLKRITDKFNLTLRKWHNARNRKRLKNRTPTLLASNCTGGFILHDLGLPFHSPFVNLYLTPKDFIRYLQRIEHYQTQPLQFIECGKTYPVAKLADLTLHFMHYESEQAAKNKWQARTQRMNLDQLFIIMTDRDGCDYQDLQAFDRLPFANKIVFTHKPYPELNSAFYLKGFEQQGQVGDLFEYTGLNGKRHYDQFDYVGWFNQAKQAV